MIITQKDMYYTFITYDKTIVIKLPPILPNRDRQYLPKSASFNSPCSNNSLSNHILQQHNNKKRRNNISTSSSSSSLSSMDDLFVVTPTTTDIYYCNKKPIMWLDPILPQLFKN